MSQPDSLSPKREDANGLTIAHSSDLHLGSGYGDDAETLREVLTASRAISADLLILAGDIFDHNRVPLAQLDDVARALGDAGLPVVILPGNHDCLVPSSVYRRGGIADPENVYVFGVTDDEKMVFDDLDLSIWGRAHADYNDMSPLHAIPERTTRWQLVTAHGHWARSASDDHLSWLITNEQIAEADADYIALGHWDRAVQAGDGSRPAYYSGSPDLARTINRVRLQAGEPVAVQRVALGTDAETLRQVRLESGK